MIDADKPCPCRSGDRIGECCEPLLAGTRAAATATQLMRSRFTAFAVGDAGYLNRTWTAADRPAHLELDPDQRWLHLEIVAARGGGLFDTEGTVEFVAHFRAAGRRGSLHEVSRFVKTDGRWLYAGSVGSPTWT